MTTETRKQRVIKYLVTQMFETELKAIELVDKNWKHMEYLSKTSDMVRFIYA